MSSSIALTDTDSRIALNALSAKIHSSLTQELTKLKAINEEYFRIQDSLNLKNNQAWDKLSILSSKWIEVLSLLKSNIYVLTESPEKNINALQSHENNFGNSEVEIKDINSQLDLLLVKVDELFSRKLELYKNIENNKFVSFVPNESQISDKFICARKNCFDKIYRGLIQYKLVSYDPNYDESKINKTLTTINSSYKSWLPFYSQQILTGFEDASNNVFHKLIFEYKSVSLEVDTTFEQYVKIDNELKNQELIIKKLEAECNDINNQLKGK